jgi:hypothetical protein
MMDRRRLVWLWIAVAIATFVLLYLAGSYWPAQLGRP